MLDCIKKSNFILKTEGFGWLFGQILKKVLFKSGLRRSETLFFYINLSKDLKQSQSIKHQSLKDLEFKVITDSKVLLSYKKKPEKMDYIPVNMWFERNSECLALVLKGRIIAYSWVHKCSYDNLGPAGILELSDKEVLLGPFYTETEFRGMGLYNILMQNSLNWLKKNNVGRAYGAGNISNIPTIKVFVKNGFTINGIVSATKNKYQILDLDNYILLSRKIKRIIN